MSDDGWSTFRQEAFGDPYEVWHDGPDFAAFRERAITDPVETERLLLAGLAEGDGLAAQSMADGPFDEAARSRFVTALTAALPASVGAFTVDAAQALIALTGSQEWSPAIIDVLVNGLDWGSRLDAAMAIGTLTPTIPLIGALMVGMNDPDYLVRYHSANSMMKFGGRDEDVSTDSELFALILDGSPPAGWKRAAAELSKAAGARLSAT